jgi:hypothetical protein
MRPLTSIPSVKAFTSEKSFSIEFDIRVIFSPAFGKHDLGAVAEKARKYKRAVSG